MTNRRIDARVEPVPTPSPAHPPGESVPRAATKDPVGVIGSDVSDGSAISVQRLTHTFFDQSGGAVVAINDVSLDVPNGQFIALVGPSGCGKTTLLNIVAGLNAAESGRIQVRDEVVLRPNRDVGYISARDALLPWRSSLKNAAFGLELRGVKQPARDERARAMLRLVGLEGYEHLRRGQLSQGMRQRVAIARTLATDPSIILMDEPFSALDQQTKLLLENKFLDIWEQSQKTVLMVTHDIEEAVAMADRVVMLSSRPGHIVLDMPTDLPRPRDVAEIRFDSHFRETTQVIWNQLKEELKHLDVTQEG